MIVRIAYVAERDPSDLRQRNIDMPGRLFHTFAIDHQMLFGSCEAVSFLF